MSTPTSDSARLEFLETKVAHLERTVQELSDVAYRQQRELDALGERHQLLLRQVEGLGSEGPDATRVEIPPHY